MEQGRDWLPETVLISGNSRLPQDAAGRSMYEVLCIVAEVETETWTVVAADDTLVTSVAREYVRRILVGRSLLEPLENVLKEVEVGYHGRAKRAILAALRELWEKAGEVRGLRPLEGEHSDRKV